MKFFGDFFCFGQWGCVQFLCFLMVKNSQYLLSIYYSQVFDKSLGTARRSNQSILKEINPEYTLEGLMLKLKLQHYAQLMERTNSSEKTLILGKIEGRRRRGQQRTRRLDGITDSVDMHLSKLWKMVKNTEAWHAAVHGVTKSWTRLSD